MIKFQNVKKLEKLLISLINLNSNSVRLFYAFIGSNANFLQEFDSLSGSCAYDWSNNEIQMSNEHCGIKNERISSAYECISTGTITFWPHLYPMDQESLQMNVDNVVVCHIHVVTKKEKRKKESFINAVLVLFHGIPQL